MCEVAVTSPEGHRWLITLKSIQLLQEMTVACFLELVLKALVELYACSEYSKENIRLIVEGKPLDNDSAPLSEYKINSETGVQMVRKVNGG